VIYDEIKNVMRISSWIKVFLVVVHAKEPQIKRIPDFEASHRMPQKQKTRKTIAELAQEVASQAKTCKEIHRVNTSLTKTVLQLL
jgi:hypothetical protein